MKTFLDTKGREWSLQLDTWGVKQVRQLVGIDLGDVLGKERAGLERLTDPVALVDTLYVLCRRQAGDRNVTDEDFGRSMAGDVLASATEALLAEVIAYCPDKATRGLIAAAVEKFRQLHLAAVGLGGRLLDGPLTQRVEALIREAEQQTTAEIQGRTPSAAP